MKNQSLNNEINMLSSILQSKLKASFRREPLAVKGKAFSTFSANIHSKYNFNVKQYSVILHELYIFTAPCCYALDRIENPAPSFYGLKINIKISLHTASTSTSTPLQYHFESLHVDVEIYSLRLLRKLVDYTRHRTRHTKTYIYTLIILERENI